MKRVLFDVNVILDVLLDRQPWAEASAAVWAAIEKGASEGMLSAHAATTNHYLLRKEMGKAGARRTPSAILKIFGMAAVSDAVLREALQSFAERL
jgi:predicted nucleic acid-binding protein